MPLDEAFEAYSLTVKMMEKYYGWVNKAIWPQYKTAEAMDIHFKSFVWITKCQINLLEKQETLKPVSSIAELAESVRSVVPL